MAPRQMKMPEKTEFEPEEKISQRKRPTEVGVSSFKSIGTWLLSARRCSMPGPCDKVDFPLLHVTVYDSVEHAGTTIAVSATS